MLPLSVELPIVLPELDEGNESIFYLRPFAVGDVDSLTIALNNKSVTERLTNIPYPYTSQHAASWIAHTSPFVTTDSDRVSFVIDVNGQVAGSVSFINLNLPQESAQVSVWIAEPFWGKGLASSALKLLIKFGFKELNLFRITAFHVADNNGTQHLMDKLGFTREGIHRQEWRKLVGDKPERFDSIYYSMLRPEWEAEQKQRTDK